ncbi:DNA-directed RNA polymerase III subunit [Citrus sinensis]|nr:DNA-directed RNA polymerase III subunit [Citrus sinensis]
MAYRGRGRGRGGYGGGGGFGFAKQEPFELFPEIELPDHKNVPIERNLILWNSRLLVETSKRQKEKDSYFSCGSFGFFMNLVSDSQSVDIERYSDWNKPKVSSNRGSINQFLQLHSSNFPAELVKDSREQRNPKRVRWNADAGMRKLDLFEKLEQKFQGQEDKDEKEKKEGEDEDEDDGEAAGEAEEEFSDDGDYNQNIDFDDDEDDFNMDDGNDDEATY